MAFGQSYAEFRNYGPSRGVMPITYAELINNSISSLSQAKKYAEEAISLYLDDKVRINGMMAGDRLLIKSLK